MVMRIIGKDVLNCLENCVITQFFKCNFFLLELNKTITNIFILAISSCKICFRNIHLRNPYHLRQERVC